MLGHGLLLQFDLVFVKYINKYVMCCNSSEVVFIYYVPKHKSMKCYDTGIV